MMSTNLRIFLAGFAALVVAAPALATDSVTVRRFALVVGVNDGGGDRSMLRFATRDAQTFASVMEELGGVAREDRILLLNPDLVAIDAGLVRLADMLKAAQSPARRLEAVFYYSGHSDEDGLLVVGRRYEYRRLREALQKLPVEVRVAVVDSCASGNLTREKGGTRRPPFLVDASNQLTGHAILTSSSATESAQESDRIGASFFTHFLVSGLRGAADVSGDRRVTVTEAYQFAFHETLARTEGTRAGAQHPNYDIGLTGSGDLVMTDLRSTTATVVLAEELTGRFFIRDADGRLVVELFKDAGRVVELGLEPGDYEVVREQKATRARASLHLDQTGRADLHAAEFVAIKAEKNRVRGDDSDDTNDADDASDSQAAVPLNPDDYEHESVSVTILPRFPPHARRKVRTNLSLSLIGDNTDYLEGAALSAGFNIASDAVHGAQLSVIANILRGDLYGAQLTAGVNMAGGTSVRGVQASGVLNYASTSVLTGWQASGGVSVAQASQVSLVQTSAVVNTAQGRELVVGQATGGVNWAWGETMSAYQAAGIANVARGSVRGVQLSGGMNLAWGESLSAFQGASVANFAQGSVWGVQAAGGANYAGALRGAQVAVVNVSTDVDGAQVGVVNVALGTVRGTQVGVVNVASHYESGLPVGLVSIVKSASFHPELWASDYSLMNVALRMDVTPSVYTLLGVGASPSREGNHLGSFEDPGTHAEYMVGMGVRLAVRDHLHVRFDGLLSSVFVESAPSHFSGETDMHVMARLLLSHAFREHLEVFGGVGAHVHMTWTPGRDVDELGRGLPSWSTRDGDYALNIWPAFIGGVSF